VGRIVDAVFIEDQCIGERTDLQQPVPVGGVPRQSRNFKAQNNSGAPEANLRHQPLKAFAVCRGSSRLTQIVINDDDAIFGPAERDRLLA